MSGSTIKKPGSSSPAASVHTQVNKTRRKKKIDPKTNEEAVTVIEVDMSTSEMLLPRCSSLNSSTGTRRDNTSLTKQYTPKQNITKNGIANVNSSFSRAPNTRVHSGLANSTLMLSAFNLLSKARSSGGHATSKPSSKASVWKNWTTIIAGAKIELKWSTSRKTWSNSTMTTVNKTQAVPMIVSMDARSHGHGSHRSSSR